MTTGFSRLALAALVFSAVGGTSGAASAAGLYFSERGVRPLGRGGAFTAGADDLSAIWYNPAGIYDAGTQFLFDASWLNFTSEYTRRSIVEQRDPNTGEVISSYEQTFDTVSGSTPIIPLPTVAGSYKINDKWVVALGIETPYAALVSYPQTVEGAPAPSRYSLITLDGSALAIVGAWAAFAPNDQWRFGAGLQVLVGKFVATTMFGACVPERFFCAQEQPEWDTLTQLSVGPIIAPSGNLGVTYIPFDELRFGASMQLPFWIRAPGSVSTRLPSTPAFEGVSQDGDEATISFELPLSAHLGVQYQPIKELAVELNGSYAAWSMHDAITVTPENVQLRNLPGFPDPYRIPKQTIQRNFQDSFSVRLGAEGDIPVEEMRLRPRLGVSFETSAIPSEYLSVLTMDMPKLTVGGGIGVEVDGWRFDAVYAHVFGFDVTVDPAEARGALLSPVQANLEEPHYVNGGDYSARANIVGLGLTYNFDYVPEGEEEPPAGEAAASTPAKPSQAKSAPSKAAPDDDALAATDGAPTDDAAEGAAVTPR